MAEYTLIPLPQGEEGDFALTLGPEAPAVLGRPGDTVTLQRRVDLLDGDVGLFYGARGMVFRQFCQDSAGNIYLFSLDRLNAGDDRMFPPGGEMPVCYGRVVLQRPIPLPMD